MASWADLPADLLEIVYCNLANCREIIKFRSVCRRWRFSAPPPPNKLSGMFPLQPSFLLEPNDRHPLFDFVINASAVYLIRSRAGAWMVSLQEASAGKLVLRHALSYKEIFDSAADVDWIAATQTPVARSYFHAQRCWFCKQVAGPHKMAFVREPSGVGGCSQLVGLCDYGFSADLFAFRMELGDSTTTSASRLHPDFHLDEVGTFNGRVFAVDYNGGIYLLDNASLELIHMNSIPRPDETNLKFVLSDGDLYLVALCYEYRPPSCQVYKLKVVTNPNNSNDDGNQIVGLVVEEVEDLGDDKVFFTSITCAFALSASRDLPPPWKGNCVVFGGPTPSACVCNLRCNYKPTTDVFVFGGGGQEPQCIPIASLQGYSDLFSPPAAAANQGFCEAQSLVE